MTFFLPFPLWMTNFSFYCAPPPRTPPGAPHPHTPQPPPLTSRRWIRSLFFWITIPPVCTHRLPLPHVLLGWNAWELIFGHHFRGCWGRHTCPLIKKVFFNDLIFCLTLGLHPPALFCVMRLPAPIQTTTWDHLITPCFVRPCEIGPDSSKDLFVRNKESLSPGVFLFSFFQS